MTSKKMWKMFIESIYPALEGLDDISISKMKPLVCWNGVKTPRIRAIKKNAIFIEAIQRKGYGYGDRPYIDLSVHVKQKTGGYAGTFRDDLASITKQTHIKNIVAKIKETLLKAKQVATKEKPPGEKIEKLKQVAKLEVVDLMAEFLAPLIILKFRTYIYASENAANPDSKVQVRCDLWFNRELKQQQFVAAEGKELTKNIINYPRKYFPRVSVDLDTKELMITEKELYGTKIIGIMNLDDIIPRICKSISGLKSTNEEKV